MNFDVVWKDLIMFLWFLVKEFWCMYKEGMLIFIYMWKCINYCKILVIVWYLEDKLGIVWEWIKIINLWKLLFYI